MEDTVWHTKKLRHCIQGRILHAYGTSALSAEMVHGRLGRGLFHAANLANRGVLPMRGPAIIFPVFYPKRR